MHSISFVFLSKAAIAILGGFRGKVDKSAWDASSVAGYGTKHGIDYGNFLPSRESCACFLRMFCGRNFEISKLLSNNLLGSSHSLVPNIYSEFPTRNLIMRTNSLDYFNSLYSIGNMIQKGNTDSILGITPRGWLLLKVSLNDYFRFYVLNVYYILSI